MIEENQLRNMLNNTVNLEKAAKSGGGTRTLSTHPHYLEEITGSKNSYTTQLTDHLWWQNKIHRIE